MGKISIEIGEMSPDYFEGGNLELDAQCSHCGDERRGVAELRGGGGRASHRNYLSIASGRSPGNSKFSVQEIPSICTQK